MICTLSGDILKPGVYEIEAGRPLREVLRRFGGGCRKGRRWKAVLSGVASGPILAKDFDVPVEFGAMQALGSGLGSAGFIAIDSGISIPAVARAVARFLYVESCNQCSACKAGLRRASLGLDGLRDALDRNDSLTEIREAAESAPQGNRCYLPVQASLLVPGLVKSFPKEFLGKIPNEIWELPKLVDYDPDRGMFRYDERQRFKQPDWTYSEPEFQARSHGAS